MPLILVLPPEIRRIPFLSLPNGNHGINVLGADNTIGGNSNFPPNLIAFNLASGIEINGSNAQRNDIGNNQIFCNERNGIRLISGGNSNKSAPDISNLQPFFIGGTSSASDRIDIYGNLLCSQNQGETYLGSTFADSQGKWLFETQVIDLSYTATATDTLGNTSSHSFVASLGAPFTPNNLVARAISPTQIELNWQDNAPNENGFRLWRSVNDTLNFTLLTQAVLGPDTSNYIDEVATNVRYFYRIQAFNNLGNSAFSNISTDSTSENILPAPSNLQARLNVNNPQELIDLSWSDNSDRETGFSIERSSIFTDGSFVEIAQVDTNQVTFQDSVRANVRYTYRVRALGTERNSIYSNVSTITSQVNDSLPLPSSPFNLDAQSVSEEQIN
ncbi:MAG: fibronectin type III domain-containing protein, partial [Bacteroidota bacterium]